jgi:hypothetical protein
LKLSRSIARGEFLCHAFDFPLKCDEAAVGGEKDGGAGGNGKAG